jgi:hypothetical protein
VTELGEKIWQGGNTAVREVRKRYNQSYSDENLLAYAVALYSFRRDRKFADELLTLTSQLLSLAEREVVRPSPADRKLYQAIATRADVLSTHLEWISRQPKVKSGALTFRNAARRVCEHGIYFATVGGELDTDHTLPLLRLTLAKLYLDQGARPSALRLAEAAQNAVALGDIPDLKQRVRVYAKLGLMYRRCGEFGRGVAWGVRAMLISGVPRNVRLKAIAAFLGIER